MPDDLVKVGSVSYINARPLVYGLEKGMLGNEVELVQDYPSAIARQLIDGHIDLGLVPVATIPHLKEYEIVGHYGIGCDGAVASVCVFSEVPVQNIRELILDYQSRTSVALLKILLNEHWKVQPLLLESAPGYEQEIAGQRAGLVIGDRALALSGRFPYVYDLGEAWKQMTGLPFVFAAWISNKKMDKGFSMRFDEVTGYGLTQLETVMAENPYDHASLQEYYTRYIKFSLTPGMHQAITLFLSKLEQHT